MSTLNQRSSRTRFSTATAVLLWLNSMIGASAAQENQDYPFLHPLFSEHAVLQREMRVPVWGWAKPGTKVTVSFARQTKEGVADATGKWLVHLDSMPASAESGTLTVRSSDNSYPVCSVEDVLVGDVWLCSGQSNMEMGVGACNITNEIATANFPLIRLLTVPRLVSKVPVSIARMHWLPCSPTTINEGLWGGFSATGFFYGRELHRQLKVPIGLIHSSWGGTIAEAWTSSSGLEPLGDFRERLAALAAERNGHGTLEDINSKLDLWFQRNDPGASQGWAKADLNDSLWKTVSMPQPFEQAGLPDFDGIVWFRREIELPEDWAGKELSLHLGPIDDIDTTWVNGTKVGQVVRYDLDRVYQVPAAASKPGKNEIAVRVLDTGGAGGMTGKPDQMHIEPVGIDASKGISLAGTWRMHDAAPLSKLPAPPQIQDPNSPNVVTVLNNGMIAPLLPFAIKGAIWYQGESNADRAYQYRTLLPAMIRDWRRQFGVGDFPFYIVQLAAFQATNAEPRDNNWAELREAQAIAASTTPNCGLAVAIDIGDANDIHPKNKLDVGRRLALCALAKTYRKKVEYSGPGYKSMKRTPQGLQLTFDHNEGGLVARGGAPKGFAIAGEDHHFEWADAVIEGKTIVLSSPKVPNPAAVRYAWDINPLCNIYNQAGLPAVPFRTDDWALTTRDKK